MGVIDTLGQGLETVNKRLWLLLLPAGLDLFFWLGPKLSVATLAGQLLGGFPQIEQLQTAQQLASEFNLFYLLALYVPTLLARWPFVVASIPGAPHWVWPVEGPAFVLALLALLPLGLLVAMGFLGTAGQLVTKNPADWRSLPRRILRYWRQAVLLHLFLVGVALLIGVPWAVMVAVSSLVSAGLAGFLVVLLQISLFWMLFYLFFALDALVVSDAGPIEAATYSMQIIRHNFWSALGLVVLIVLISNGLPLIWKTVAQEVWGVPLAIAGNAYVGTWMALASLLYYRDRVVRLPARRAGPSPQVTEL